MGYQKFPFFRYFLIILLAALCTMLSSCSTRNQGSDEISFLRNGELWTVSPEDSTLAKIVSSSNGLILNFALSPDSHQFTYQALNGKQQQTGNSPFKTTNSILYVVGIDGGEPLPITASDSNVLRSTAWWDKNGNRLIYFEQNKQNSYSSWWISQADQPLGIARKQITDITGPPDILPDGSMATGITSSGQIVIYQSGGTSKTITSDAVSLLGNGMPARALWQPGQQNILYLAREPLSGSPVLHLINLSGRVSATFNTQDVQDFSWSPDGKYILIRSSTHYTILDIHGNTVFTWSIGAPSSAAYWSPDSAHILVQKPAGLDYVDIGSHLLQHVVSYPSEMNMDLNEIIPGMSPWNKNSKTFLFTAPAGSQWMQNTTLKSEKQPGDGLYTVLLNSDGSLNAASPKLIDWGLYEETGWSTAFLNNSMYVP